MSLCGGKRWFGHTENEKQQKRKQQRANGKKTVIPGNETYSVITVIWVSYKTTPSAAGEKGLYGSNTNFPNVGEASLSKTKPNHKFLKKKCFLKWTATDDSSAQNNKMQQENVPAAHFIEYINVRFSNLLMV